MVRPGDRRNGHMGAVTALGSGRPGAGGRANSLGCQAGAAEPDNALQATRDPGRVRRFYAGGLPVRSLLPRYSERSRCWEDGRAASVEAPGRGKAFGPGNAMGRRQRSRRQRRWSVQKTPGRLPELSAHLAGPPHPTAAEELRRRLKLQASLIGAFWSGHALQRTTRRLDLTPAP